MEPRRGKDEGSDSDDFFLLESQAENNEETAFEKALAIQYAAVREKKRQEKEKNFLQQASVVLNKDLSRAIDEVQTVSESLEAIFTDFVNEHAAVEDRIHKLWLDLTEEHQVLETFLSKRYDSGIILSKNAERQHMVGLSKLRAACEESEQAIIRMVPVPGANEEKEDMSETQ